MNSKTKNPLIKTIYADETNLLAQVKMLIAEGADPNERTEYFETPLRIASNNGRFNVVEFLYKSGADPTHLNWTALFHAVAYGDLQKVTICLEKGDSISDIDTWDRTPLLVAVQSGSIEKVQCLIDAGATIAEQGRCEKPALEYAIQMDNADMLTFLIKLGADMEHYNSFGYTALMEAAEHNAISCVHDLLEHGANVYRKDRSQFSRKSAIAQASSVEMAEILAVAGADLNELDSEVRASMLKIGTQDKLAISQAEYQQQKYREFGTSNPQVCDILFCYEMIRCNFSAWHARRQFNDDCNTLKDKPVWSYERFGKSITALGNGEYIEIAGEHEDHYDPDFCIYNEVFHHRNNGQITIYQYPKEVFPPTDFHTATLVSGKIYIIGNLGNYRERVYGITPVYVLNTLTFKIVQLDTTGECPGWIYDHTAYFQNTGSIRVQGGNVLTKHNDSDKLQLNEYDFELDLITLRWTKHEHVPLSGLSTCFSEELKRFKHNDGTLLAAEQRNGWKLIKVVSVHCINVKEGQVIAFADKTVAASCEDYIYAVAYSTSTFFNSIELLEKAVEDNSWEIESGCQVCRTTTFPEYGRYIGFSKITEAERDAFSQWKQDFAEEKVTIA